jgi:hypothetical protein
MIQRMMTDCRQRVQKDRGEECGQPRERFRYQQSNERILNLRVVNNLFVDAYRLSDLHRQRRDNFQSRANR